MQNFKIIGKPLLGEKYVEERKRKKEERIMPSLVATTSALARTTCVRMHYVRTNERVFIYCLKSVCLLKFVLHNDNNNFTLEQCYNSFILTYNISIGINFFNLDTK